MDFTVEPSTWSNGLDVQRIDETFAKVLLDKLSCFSGVQPTKKAHVFPGPNPVSLERADYPKFRAQPYHVTEKTDGIRALMMIADIESKHMCVIFDRTLTPFLFRVHKMPRALYQGTVFDGEIVYDTLDQRWIFLCFDALNVAGVPVFHIPFSKRLEAISTSLRFYEHCDGDTGVIRPKTFVPFVKEVEPVFLKHLDDMKMRYPVDGIIFMPEYDRVIYGRHDNLMKLKTTHSIDFSVKGGKLYIYDEVARRNKMIGTPTGPNAHLAQDGVIVECTLDPASKKTELWTVMSVRADKKTSNNKFTFGKTLVNIREALRFQDVLHGAFDVSAAGNPIWN